MAKAIDEQVAQARSALDVFGTLSREGKVQFAKKLQDTKAAKNFGWVKDFKQSISRDQIDKNKVVSKYMTRTC